MVCWVLEIGVSTPHPPERLKHTLHILVLQLVDPFLGVTQRAKNQLEEAWVGIRRDKRKKKQNPAAQSFEHSSFQFRNHCTNGHHDEDLCLSIYEPNAVW